MINKWTILLLFLVIVGGGIYLIPKIEITETIQYEKIEKLDCGHYDVTLLNGTTYHGHVEQIDISNQTATITSFGSFLIMILLWCILILYAILQCIVWGTSRYFFDTDFFQAWWEYAHRPIPEEYKQVFKTFFGYP